VKSISRISLSEALRRLRRGELSSRALTEAAIERHRKFGGRLNAYRSFAPDTALRRASEADKAFSEGRDLGPLQGIPVSVKDLFGVDGMPVYAGTPRRLPSKWEQEGPLVARLQAQLGVIVGKSHTVEFALGGLGTNRHYGSPYNPWDPKEQRISGGSSSGAGLSLLEGSALVAIASDTTGSIRMPASMTGTVGLMISHGRWPIEGIVPVSPILDAPGLLTLTAADLAPAFLALDGSAGKFEEELAWFESGELAGVRIGVAEGLFWEGCSPGIAEAVNEALGELERRGVELVPVELTELSAVYEMFQDGHLSAAAVYSMIRNEFPDWWETLDNDVRDRLTRHGAELPAHEYVRRFRRIEDWMRAASASLDGLDAIALPTISVTPARVADLEGVDAYREHNMSASRNSAVIALLGLCALSMPAGFDAARMPVGLQLASRHGRDADLIRLAIACERVLGTRPERMGEPPLLAAP
jgi:aspartyl-tRNA(Asn)/glutamyl-tRNA(Gln) amidotransferase subunit A